MAEALHLSEGGTREGTVKSMAERCYRAPLRMRRLAFTLALAAFACASPDAWQRARAADTAEAYRAFVSQHPKADEVEAAQERLRELDFEEASRVQSALGWKRFLEEHPEGPEVRAARARLEAIRFSTASQRDTLEGWKLFLADHPDGAHADEARARANAAEDRLAASTDDPRALDVLARAHAGDARGQEARARLDDQRFSRAAGARAWLAYLAEFPEGAHRLEAQAALFSLELDGLLASGERDAARSAWERSPLGPRVPGFPARLAEAEAARALFMSKDLRVQRALPNHVLRPTPELLAALSAVDPLERWQAAEELGEVVSVRVLDPLMDAWQRGRNLLVRERAFASLQRVVRALPAPVAEHQLATRIESLRAQAATPELQLALATWLDLLGEPEQAAAEYQKAWQGGQPDPAVLARWILLRTERRQHFSAAVAARQLALWAKDAAAGLEVAAGPVLPVGVAREACAAAEGARWAREALRRARQEKTEFPEDVLQFSALAEEAGRLAEARLQDAELRMKGEIPAARTCRDDSVGERLRAGRVDRAEALRALAAARHPLAALAARQARQADPEPAVRIAAEGH